MINQDEARELAARKRCADVGDMEIEEFDLGYVAWETVPLPDDPTRPPDRVGDGCLVVDKETGEVSTWPSWGPEGVMEAYREAKRGGLGARSAISPEEARELAARRRGAASSEMEIEEFEIGYVA